MRCTVKRCTGRLRVTNTWTVGTHKFQRATCSECKKVYRVECYTFPAERRNQGAKAKAAEARKKGEPQPEAGQGSPE